MKSFIITFIFSILFFTSNAQTSIIPIDKLIEKVNIDTLTKYVNDLSGENSVIINGVNTRIVHRIDSWGNDLAADYILETLHKTGLFVDDNIYSTNGRNIIAIQTGTEHPEIFYIICAHYDAVPNYGADDNASGTAAVLEAARILSEYNLPYSIIYALWDQEEIGLIGSRNWANNAKDNNVKINGVINLDMIAYSNLPGNKLDIHTSASANSTDLANYVSQFCRKYHLLLNPTIHNPGNTYSDHKPFWDNNYSAIFLIEPLAPGYFNPQYHTEHDRINIFNMDYFHEMSRLGIGSIASLASGEIYTATDELIQYDFDFKIYPNPSHENSIININLLEPSQVKIDILSITGITLKTIADKFLISGKHEFILADMNLPSGIYLVRLRTDIGNQYHKLIILK